MFSFILFLPSQFIILVLALYTLYTVRCEKFSIFWYLVCANPKQTHAIKKTSRLPTGNGAYAGMPGVLSIKWAYIETV